MSAVPAKIDETVETLPFSYPAKELSDLEKDLSSVASEKVLNFRKNSNRLNDLKDSLAFARKKKDDLDINLMNHVPAAELENTVLKLENDIEEFHSKVDVAVLYEEQKDPCARHAYILAFIGLCESIQQAFVNRETALMDLVIRDEAEKKAQEYVDDFEGMVTYYYLSREITETEFFRARSIANRKSHDVLATDLKKAEAYVKKMTMARIEEELCALPTEKLNKATAEMLKMASKLNYLVNPNRVEEIKEAFTSSAMTI